MPYYVFRTIWTPLTLLGVIFYKEQYEDRIWIKIGNKPRRPLINRE